MAEQYVYEVDISEEGITKAFKRIEESINRLADVMEASLKRVESAGDRSFDKIANKGKQSLKEVEQAAVSAGEAIEEALNVEPEPYPRPDPRKFPDLYDPRTRGEIYQQHPETETPRTLRIPDLGGAEGAERLEEYNRQLAQAQTAERELILARENQIATQARLEQQLIQLTAAELKNIYSADATTRTYINLIAATSRSTNQFNEALLANERITQAQINYASSLAQIKQRIELVNKSYGEQIRTIATLQEKVERLGNEQKEIDQGTILGTAKNSKKIREDFQKTNEELRTQRAIANALEKELKELIGALNKAEEEEEAMADSAAQNVAAVMNQVEAVDQFKRGLQALAIVAQKQQTAGSREAIQILRNYPQQAKQIQDLIKQHGNYEFQLGRSAAAQGRVQQETARVISTDRNLVDQLDKVVKKYGEVNLAINGSDFNRFNNEAKISGSRIGVLSGLVSTLTNRLINLAEQLARTFAQFLKDSTTVASQFEQTKISLNAIFEGNTAAAGAFFDFVRSESRRVGTDITALAVQFAPQVESFEQLSRIAELSAEVLRLPGAIAQGRTQTDFIIALGELLGGQVKSIQSRFNIPIEATTRIKELQEEFGSLEGALRGLEEFTDKYGVSFEQALGTAPVLVGQIKEEFRDLQALLGQPILEALTDGLKEAREFIEENKTEIKELAIAIGTLVESLASATFDEIFQAINDGSLTRFIDQVRELNELFIRLNSAREAVGDVMRGLSSVVRVIQAVGSLGLSEIFRNSITGVESLNTALLGLADIFALVSGSLVGGITAISATILGLDEIIRGEISGSEYGEIIKEAFLGGLVGTREYIHDLLGSDEVAENTRLYGERTEALNEDAEAGRDWAEAQMTANNLLTEQNALLEENATALEKVNEKRAEANLDIKRKELEIDLEYQRSILEAEKDFSREREEIGRKNQDKIDDIFREHYDDLEDLAIENKRDGEDLDRDAGRKRQDLEKDITNKLIDLELEYQRKLEDIRRQFEFDAQEAIRDNDAIRYLQIKRRMQFELEQAKIERDRKEADLGREGDARRAELQLQLDREREDAKVSNDRKLEDLKLALDRALEEQRIAKAREIRDQEIAEKQKIEDLKQSYIQQLEDFEQYKRDKIQDLNLELKEELDLIEENLARIEEIEAESYKNRLDLFNKFVGDVIGIQEQLNVGGSQIQGYGIPAGYEPPEGGYDVPTVDVPDDLTELTIGQLRLLARQLAGVLGFMNNEDIQNIINANDRSRIERLIENLERIQETGDTTIDPIPRRYGGDVTPGNTYLVGEKGPELLDVGFRGRVRPLDRIDNFSIPGLAMGTTIDNRREQNINLSMLDPNHLSPTQLAIITEVVKQMFVSVQNA